MRGRRNSPVAAVALAICMIGTQAAADEPTTPMPTQAPPVSEAAVRADALFQEGKQLFEAGKFVEACSRFAESDALEPTVSALGLLAGCHEQQGKLATAWKEYRETAKRAETTVDSRAAFARERASALEPRLPRLAVSLARPLPGIEVLRNADRVPSEELGVDVPVDPGTWEIVVRAPDRQEFRATAVAKEGTRTAVSVPELKPLAASPALRNTPSHPGSAALPKPISPQEPGNPRVPAALISGGLGFTGIGVGIALGAWASDQNTASKTLLSLCVKTGQGCPEGRKLRDGAFSTAAASTVGFGIGIAGLGISAVLLLLPNRKPTLGRPPATGLQVTPLASPQGGGAAVTGRF